MSVFSIGELAYFAEPNHLGRLATVDDTGQPRIVPLGWRYNPDLDTIDIGGRDPAEFVATHKFRDVQRQPKVAFVVDDVLPPWQPRCVIVHGTADAIHTHATAAGDDATALIRITPTNVISWGLPVE
ncbi:PPOX class F420-dependent oxidoreductase [Iamia sp.]|uniref:PPOX class F420-dependent oxidoreductase n=1 Tax=Iamia sp. TaxID=2722710 RepID=UPI002D16ABD7|nr:PPOX class F420-dependent oxidoreductase [Iamia sp.]HXH57948.1 PPOX class F420-dependent oxidoreductase [Iamia sp.]